MSLLTIFTSPKPFVDPHISIIQRNALRSWQLLGPEAEVVLLGNDPGVAEAAAEFGARHIPDVDYNEQGVPYIDSMFERARQVSDSPALAIINTDIILFPDFVAVTRAALAQFKSFVLVGCRWDLEIVSPINFEAGWEARLRAEIESRGKVHQPSGSDYFLFSRNTLTGIPPFTIGRAGWDNWMIHHALHQAWTTLDASADVTIIHQNHDYHHLPGGEIHYNHPESQRNVAVGGGARQMSDLRDMKFALVDGRRVRLPLTWARMVRKLERLIQPDGKPQGLRGGLYHKLRQYRKGLER